MIGNEVLQSISRLNSALQRLSKPIQSIIQPLQHVSQAITPFLESIAPYIEHFVRYKKFIDSVQSTGWLPYHTVSLDYVEGCGNDVSLLDASLKEFYEQNWKNIRQDIEMRLNHYRISEEAKATFREALFAHEVGHYRCVCRVLFPEIDREFRKRFFEDSAGSISSKKMLEKLKSEGSPKDYLPREAYGWMLLDRLVHHLYEPINDSNWAQYEVDYVPNRHASAHGLVSYSTFKHSMNMIVMADYIFQILTSMAKLTSPQQ